MMYSNIANTTKSYPVSSGNTNGDSRVGVTSQQVASPFPVDPRPEKMHTVFTVFYGNGDSKTTRRTPEEIVPLDQNGHFSPSPKVNLWQR